MLFHRRARPDPSVDTDARGRGSGFRSRAVVAGSRLALPRWSRHPMLQRVLALVLAFCATSTVQAQWPLPDADRKALESESRFRTLADSELLPREVSDFCADINGLLAMPGDRWSATDARSAGGILPTRRLVWAARSDAYFVVHYEQGGFAHTYHVVVASAEPDASAFKLIWRASGPRLRDYPNFVRALKANDFDSEPLLHR